MLWNNYNNTNGKTFQYGNLNIKWEMTAYILKFGHTYKFDTCSFLHLVAFMCIYFWSTLWQNNYNFMSLQIKSHSFKSYVGHLHEISWILLHQQSSFLSSACYVLLQFTIYHMYILVNFTLLLNSIRFHYFYKKHPTKIWDHI